MSHIRCVFRDAVNSQSFGNSPTYPVFGHFLHIFTNRPTLLRVFYASGIAFNSHATMVSARPGIHRSLADAETFWYVNSRFRDYMPKIVSRPVLSTHERTLFNKVGLVLMPFHRNRRVRRRMHKLRRISRNDTTGL